MKYNYTLIKVIKEQVACPTFYCSSERRVNSACISRAAAPHSRTSHEVNRKNEVSWIRSDKRVASCRLHWFPSHTIPVPFDSHYMHHHICLLPGVTALQQGSGRLPEFSYKPLQGEDGVPALSVDQQQHRCLQDQHLEPLAQSVQAASVHQGNLRAEGRDMGHVSCGESAGICSINVTNQLCLSDNDNRSPAMGQLYSEQQECGEV